MKQLSPLIVKDEYVKLVERDINQILWAAIYKPIFEILQNTALEFQNANDPLSHALQSGKIYYQDGKFIGKFNAAISKELRAMGAKFKNGEWYLATLPPQISMAVAGAGLKFEALSQKIIQALDSADYETLIADAKLSGTYAKVTDQMEAAFQKTVKSVSVAPKLTDDMKANIAEAWGENLEVYIKDWADNNVLELRQLVSQNTFAGQRTGNLTKIIQKNYGVSKNKAKFLARQETSLLMSKFREERYKSIGVLKYRWSSSNDERVRDRHRELNGKIFEWTNPPISGANGERQHAGEPFGCRCVAVAIVD
jgi:SPP1 gp7 family putative phage head morphogenesis protein